MLKLKAFTKDEIPKDKERHIKIIYFVKKHNFYTKVKKRHSLLYTTNSKWRLSWKKKKWNSFKEFLWHESLNTNTANYNKYKYNYVQHKYNNKIIIIKNNKTISNTYFLYILWI